MPHAPTGINIPERYHDGLETTINLDWDPAQGSGPEAVVDYYVISISPAPPYQPSINMESSPPWNVTLAHNQLYTGNITAINCAGESMPSMLPSIEFGKQTCESISLMNPHFHCSKLSQPWHSSKWLTGELHPY